VILTGIRAEVAEALVSLGVELSGIVTLGTLKDGIAFALRR
jgi:anti-anti-sigma regulatory factor